MGRGKLKIGVLGIQGSIEEHAAALRKCGADVLMVKSADDLRKVRGLIIPGGESTHLGMMLRKNGLFELLKKRARGGMPIFGTCAGAILLARKNFGVIDVEVERNAYGRQIDSFEADIKISAIGASGGGAGEKLFHAVFIRAPKIKKVGGGVEILAKYGDEIVMARQKNILISCFHPELTNDLRVHKYFLGMVGFKSRLE